MSWPARIVLLVIGSGLVLGLYVFVIADEGPSSQSAEIGVVVDRVDPENSAGLRVDVLINVPVHRVGGCDDEVDVKAIISGTPKFWANYATKLDGTHRVGIGLRTSYDDKSLRIADWKGYDLPSSPINLGGHERVQAPQRSGRVALTSRADADTGAELFTAAIIDWGEHRTPLVMEFKASITSPRARGSCYLALPEILGVGTSTLLDAEAAAKGLTTISDLRSSQQARGAVTFGRVIVRTNGRLLDGEARPNADFVDGNPWVSGIGDVGEEAAVWRCSASTARAQWTALTTRNAQPGEVALDPSATENDTCAGLAVIEARGMGTFRDAALLIVGGIFSLLLGALIKHGYTGASALWGRKDSAQGDEPEA